MTPYRFGGGCLGWTLFLLFWSIAAFALVFVFPIVLIGWLIILFAVAGAIGGGGGA
jgi:hypothetical protein